MRSLVAPTLAIGISSFVGAGYAAPALGCSVCQPGDPVFSAEGASAQQVGSLQLYVENRRFWKKSGALPHHDAEEEHHDDAEHSPSRRDREENLTHETVLFTSWTPVDRLTLTASVPFRCVKIEEMPHDEPSHNLRNSGLGDVSLYATGVLWRNREVLPSRWLEGRLMLKLPTGQDEKRVGGVLDPHLQVGTGSWDWGLGIAGTQRFERGSMYASVFYRFNSKGGLDYEYGDVFLANVAWTTDAAHLGLFGTNEVRGALELNYRSAEKDDFRGLSYGDSGGDIFYASPYLELDLRSLGSERSPRLRLGLRIPLGSGGLNGDQQEGYIFQAGLGFTF